MGVCFIGERGRFGDFVCECGDAIIEGVRMILRSS